MVAQAGKGWRLAPSLVQLWRECNALAPRRSRASDGSIGDASHQSRSSFHNPWGGVVDALDITHDPKNGMDAHWWARRVVAVGDTRLDHIISNGQIWSRARAEMGWRKYTGANPHRTHAHFGVRRDAVGRNSMATWLGKAPKPPAPAPPAPKPPAPPPAPKPPPAPPAPKPPAPEEFVMATKEELEAVVRQIVAEEHDKTRTWTRDELTRQTASLTTEFRGRLTEELHKTRQWIREELRRSVQALTHEIRRR